jgi:hypothetical protein
MREKDLCEIKIKQRGNNVIMFEEMFGPPET